MTLSTEWVDYGPNKGHRGYFAYPKRAHLPLPAVLVVQEVWGVDAHIQDVTRQFAAAGYAAFAPDLYATGGKRPNAVSHERVDETVAFVNELSDPHDAFDADKRKRALAQEPPERAQRIDETMGALIGGMSKGLAPFLPPIEQAAAMLRDACSVTAGQKLACVGYCMGGGFAAMLATRDPKLAAAVVYYGTPPPAEDIPKIQCPVEGFYGEQDARFVKPLPELHAAMEKHGKRFRSHVYKGAGHAFNNNTRPSYNAAAARDALVHTLGLLHETLSPRA